MVLKDKLGQTVRLDSESSERNPPVAEAEVKFIAAGGCGRHRHAHEMNLQRLWWALGALLVAAAMVVCLVPDPGQFRLHSNGTTRSAISLGHGTLAVYFAGLVPRRSWWKIFVFLLLFGIAIEFAQYFMRAGREGDPRDVLANSAGAALGLVAARLGLARWPEIAAWLLGRRATQ